MSLCQRDGTKLASTGASQRRCRALVLYFSPANPRLEVSLRRVPLTDQAAKRRSIRSPDKAK